MPMGSSNETLPTDLTDENDMQIISFGRKITTVLGIFSRSLGTALFQDDPRGFVRHSERFP